MEPRDSHKGRSAWTMIEVVMVTVSLAILLPLLVGAVANARQKEKVERVTSVGTNQETITLACALSSQDHLVKYAMGVPAVGGTMGLKDLTETWRTLEVLPSQSALPQLTLCPLNDFDWAARIGEPALATNRLVIP